MTRQGLCLQLLIDAGPKGVRTGEFLRAGVGSRYSARVRELREMGYSITSERVRAGEWLYVLNESSAQPPSVVARAEPARDGGQPPSSPRSSEGGGESCLGGADPGGVSPRSGPAPEEESAATLFDPEMGAVSALTGKPVPWPEKRAA